MGAPKFTEEELKTYGRGTATTEQTEPTELQNKEERKE